MVCEVNKAIPCYIQNILKASDDNCICFQFVAFTAYDVQFLISYTIIRYIYHIFQLKRVMGYGVCS